MNSYGLAWSIPFFGLLLTIGLAPVVAPTLWHRHFVTLVAAWALAFLVADIVHEGVAGMLHAAAAILIDDYIPFVILLGTLFAIAGGFHVTGVPRASPAVNTALLLLGTILASAVGTTGASMVMLRPLIRANRHRRQTTHVFVFFIFLVANIGGALTPLGNPPIFLGFLLGVPFAWPAIHLALPTLLLVFILLTVFFALDTFISRRGGHHDASVLLEIEKLGIDGKINLVLLAAAIGAILLRAFWHPQGGLTVLGVEWNAIDMATNALLIAIGVMSLLLTRASVRRANEFSWHPMVEVAVIFAAIFITLVPVAAMVAAGPDGAAAPLFARLFANGPNDHAFYWLTGGLSALLDNAPTYVVFFGLAGNNPTVLTTSLSGTLTAISLGAVFFGGMTYIGNAPNLMIKAIVERYDMRMPSFFVYLGWSSLCLLPWLFVVDRLFLG